MLRKHINTLDSTEFEKVPFKSWDCITLFLGHREVDIVIRDEKDMSLFIQYLIYKMKTVDGKKDSAIEILDHLKV